MKSNHHVVVKTFIAIGLAAVVFSAKAEQGDERPRRGPPPEAINACGGKTEGAACHFTGRFNEMLNGSCHTGPMGVLACRPKPPQVAFEACQGKNEGDACSFMEHMNNAVKGICHKDPTKKGALVCAHKNQMQPLEENEQPEQLDQSDQL